MSKKKDALIMSLLAKHGELYGHELVEKSNRKLWRGWIYVRLNRLEDKGLITSREEPVEPYEFPRRLYRTMP